MELEEAGDLLGGIGFDFDADGWVEGFGAGDACDEFGGVACGHEVIVFDHDHVVEAGAVVGAAAGANGGFFEPAPAGGGFAGIEDAGGGVGDGVDGAAGLGGDAAEALEEVEGGAFCGEDAAGWAGEGDDFGAWGEGCAVGEVGGDGDFGIEFAEDLGGGFGAGEDAFFPGDDVGGGGAVFGDEAGSGDVAWAEVFGEGHADELEDGVWEHGRENLRAGGKVKPGAARLAVFWRLLGLRGGEEPGWDGVIRGG